MTEDPGNCKGCLEYAGEQEDCLIPDEFTDVCPCQNCVVKMMCEKACEAFDKLVDSYMNEMDKNQ